MSNKAGEGKSEKGSGGLVPRLRFPGHFGDEDWKLIKICEIGYILGGLSGKSAVDFVCGSPYVTYRQVFSQAKIDFSACDKVTIAVDETQNTLQKGDIIFTGSSETPEEVGISSVVVDDVGFPVYLNSFCFILRPGSMATLLPSFSMYLFQSPQYRASVTAIAQGSTRFNLSKSAFRELSVSLPEKVSEQDKIADCLSSIDDLITLESQKLNALKTHKKGLMQQLFPAEGETVPRLRFPEFGGAGEWYERELGPLTTKVGSGITPTGGDKNYKTKGRPFVRSQNVGWGELILNDVAFIDEETHQSFDSTEIKVSDVLLNITGASIGRSAVADSRIVGGNVNQHVCIIRAQQVELNPALLNHFLISERGQKQIDSFQAGGNRQGLNFAQIRSFVIPLPPTEHEQRMIATCLASLDDLITAQTQKLNALKAHKKGLMQQLFPNPELSNL